jgi:L-arabinokinase
MDQLAITLGKRDHFLAIECQPDRILDKVRLPKGTAAVGINSKVQHAVIGSKYTDTRVATFMGHRIIMSLLWERGQAAERQDPMEGYVARITPKQFTEEFEGHLPSRITGRDFINRYGDTCDPATEVDAECTYHVRSCTSHPIHENARVKEFIECLKKADGTGGQKSLVRAGQLMYESHGSYRNRCGLDCPETNLLVELTRDIGLKGGVYGAKITGGGAGGTVAVLGREDIIMDSVDRIVDAYQSRTGIDPDVFAGTSPGMLEFGHLECVPV